MAITLKNMEVIDLLLKNGADKHKTNKNGESSLKMAKEIPPIFEMMVGAEASRLTVRINRSETIIKKNSINAVDEYGQTALHKAAYENRIDIVYGLLVGDCEINCTDRNGWTPLHCAANKGNLDVCLMLLNNKNIDVNAKTTNDTFVVHYLSRLIFNKVSENEKLINVLNMAKDRGMHLNVKEKYGETPLHQAAVRSNFIVAKWLLDNGALVNPKTLKSFF